MFTVPAVRVANKQSGMVCPRGLGSHLGYGCLIIRKGHTAWCLSKYYNCSLPCPHGGGDPGTLRCGILQIYTGVNKCNSYFIASMHIWKMQFSVNNTCTMNREYSNGIRIIFIQVSSSEEWRVLLLHEQYLRHLGKVSRRAVPRRKITKNIYPFICKVVTVIVHWYTYSMHNSYALGQ
jgi:hypothetical protein